MSVSTIEGIVESGQIRLLGNVKLPESAKVYVVVPDLAIASTARIPSPRLVHPEQAREFVKQAFESPADA